MSSWAAVNINNVSVKHDKTVIPNLLAFAASLVLHVWTSMSLANIIFVTWKLIRVSYEFFYVEFKYVIRIALSSTVLCERIFLSRCHCVLNMASVLYYISNIVWAWKHNHNEDSRHVSPIKDSQTVQSQTRTDTMGQKTSLHPKTVASTSIAYSRTEKCCKYSINQHRKSLFTSAAQQSWIYKKLRQGNGSK
jgi:hypothetical protein